MSLVFKVYHYLFQFDNTVGPALLSLRVGSRDYIPLCRWESVATHRLIFPLAHISLTPDSFYGTK